MNVGKLTVSAVFCLTACSPSEEAWNLPAVNDENCMPDQIAKIRNKDARAAFGSACFRQGTLTPSKKREW